MDSLIKPQQTRPATLTGLAFAGALSLVCYQSADAVPADAGAMKRAATATSTVQEAQKEVQEPQSDRALRRATEAQVLEDAKRLIGANPAEPA